MPRVFLWMVAAISVVSTGLPIVAATALRAERRLQVQRPRRNSLEYRLSMGLPAIRANGAYARGATGNGVTIAMIDTGIGKSASMFERLSPDSIDLLDARQAADVNAEHGEQTATLLGGALDGAGIVGVAYGATLMSIRADIDGSCEQVAPCADPIWLGGSTMQWRTGRRSSACRSWAATGCHRLSQRSRARQRLAPYLSLPLAMMVRPSRPGPPATRAIRGSPARSS
jgi:hypothetical protein